MKAIIDGISCEMSVAEFIEFQRNKEIDPLNVQLPEVEFTPKKKNSGVGLRRPIRIKYADHNSQVFRSQKILCQTYPALNYCLLSAKHSCAEDYVRGQANVVRKALASEVCVTEFSRWTLEGREIRVEFPVGKAEVAR